MKKTILFVAVSILILNAAGCGRCRGLFGRNQAMAAPMYGHMAAPCAATYAPTCCEPVCCQPACDPCCSGTSMSAGYSGFESGAMMAPADGGCACGQ